MQPNYGNYGYAQPAPPAAYGAPIPQPAPPMPNYGQPAPAPQPAQAFTVPTFHEPTLGSGLPTPGPRHLENRAVAFFNVTVSMGQGYNSTEQVEKVTYDVLVLDGGPMAWGDDQDKGLPPVLAVQQVPYEARGCIASAANFVSNLRKIAGQPGQVYLGRVVRGQKGQKGRPPWLITQIGSELDPYAAHAPQVTAALRDLVTRRFAHGSTLPDNPVPIEINGGPRKDPQQAQPAPVQPPVQQYAQPPAGAVQYAAPVQPTPVDQPAPGFTPEIWAALSPEQKAMFRG